MKEFKGLDLGRLSDGDPRVDSLLKRMREVWDNAPVNAAMDGEAIRVPGYVVPLEETRAGLKEFLLVPYFGACMHSPPPPANQIIHVKPKGVPAHACGRWTPCGSAARLGRRVPTLPWDERL